jgi:hypothetical protein
MDSHNQDIEVSWTWQWSNKQTFILIELTPSTIPTYLRLWLYRYSWYSFS